MAEPDYARNNKLKAFNNGFARHAFVFGHRTQDSVERAHAQTGMSRNGDAVRRRGLCL